MAKSADAFRTISEVAEWLETPAHVLRFWESRFSQVKPVKRAGGRRYYRPADMLLLGGIKKLLHEDGMTIKGAQKLLRTDGVKKVSALSQPLDRQDHDVIDLQAVDTSIEVALDPEPEITLDPKPEAAPIPEPTSVIPTELEPAQPEVAIPPSIPAADTFDAPQPEVAAQSSDAAPETADDVGAQLSSIYSRLSALHDRMKANNDPKQ